MPRTRWNEHQVAILRACYPVMPTAAIARQLGRDERAVYAKASALHDPGPGIRQRRALLEVVQWQDPASGTPAVVRITRSPA